MHFPIHSRMTNDFYIVSLYFTAPYKAMTLPTIPFGSVESIKQRSSPHRKRTKTVVQFDYLFY